MKTGTTLGPISQRCPSTASRACFAKKGFLFMKTGTTLGPISQRCPSSAPQACFAKQGFLFLKTGTALGPISQRCPHSISLLPHSATRIVFHNFRHCIWFILSKMPTLCFTTPTLRNKDRVSQLQTLHLVHPV